MTSIRQLKDQKRTVLEGMADSKNAISNMEDKVSRLQGASSNLATSISEVEILKSSISDLKVDSRRWKGKEKKNFEDAYSSYKESMKNYFSRTEEAKDAIDEDIKRYEAKIDTYTIGLNNLEITLDVLNKQINQAQKE
ncbi:YwqH-like family protein [Pseudogracilibacillus auburnensis]|uniref:YwqH-like family protein n=1 Tax=Pseudogracilibacillus auburnensis TaxID=1494959 RepID=UPI001A96AE25|nr:DUF5082 family protein [Pseudogracilibacillus auburnensis]MBO1003924.1 DUF5082 family protein [Pseudogracilibacillus auburnensis]